MLRYEHVLPAPVTVANLGIRGTTSELDEWLASAAAGLARLAVWAEDSDSVSEQARRRALVIVRAEIFCTAFAAWLAQFDGQSRS